MLPARVTPLRNARRRKPMEILFPPELIDIDGDGVADFEVPRCRRARATSLGRRSAYEGLRIRVPPIGSDLILRDEDNACN